ncbi:apolipoprotein N-acyltransferase [Lyticum sinuosum]|uniref:Apolipoprotein N-acyltransferase n=1 Tax=Lyticum sinuosum TaxID=1332059 RepID=A0AAE4VM14_9RICK|nr:apolipoprotein N-acyltransferase [Lyticum sinuosum]MDZ5761019.1 Apolipoprotein N-acyltransferase [Lyticum sinuosum]
MEVINRNIKNILKDIILIVFFGGILTTAFSPFNIFLTIFFSFYFLVYIVENNIYKNYLYIFILIIIFLYSHFYTGLRWISCSFDSSSSTKEEFGWAKYITQLGLPLILVWPQSIGLLLAFGITKSIGKCVNNIQNHKQNSFHYEYSYKKCYYDNNFSVTHFTKQQKYILSILLAFFWVLGEKLRINYIEPFPWLLLSHISVYHPILLQLIEILEIEGLGFYIVILAITPYVNCCRWSFAIGLISSLLFSWSYWRYHYISSLKISLPPILIVQAGIKEPPQNNNEKIKALEKIIFLTQNAQAIAHKQYKKSIIIIWPESAMQFPINYNNKFIPLNWSNKNFDDILISGVDRIKKNKKNIYFYNSLIILNKSGSIIGEYDKINLAPFGEYMPWKGFLSKLTPLSVSESDFEKGKLPQEVFIPMFNTTIIPYICYDIAFDEKNLSKKIINNNSNNFIIHIANDSWFRDSIGLYQHLAMSQIKAVQLRRYLVRVANMGVSGIITPTGDIIYKLPVNYIGAKFYNIN